jgi:hypothetical protein
VDVPTVCYVYRSHLDRHVLFGAFDVSRKQR